MSTNTKTSKYLHFVCSKCKTFLALEQKKPKRNRCPHIIGYDHLSMPIRCKQPLPSQDERNKMNLIQYHTSCGVE